MVSLFYFYTVDITLASKKPICTTLQLRVSAAIRSEREDKTLTINN